MFRWHKEIDRLDIPASQVLHLERSLSAVQVALPGLPSQEATAYLCAFAAGKGLRVTLVLHLHTSRCLAFYLHERAEAPRQEAGRLIEEGVLFAESMGFTLSDMDFRKLDIETRDALWGSLPLKAGAEPAPPVAPAASFLATEEPPAAVVAPMAGSLSTSETTMRARARKQPPSAEVLTARRQKLLESLGRFLASL